MLPLARNGYTEAEVKKALHAASRTLRFRYNLLDKNDNFIRELYNVLSGEVKQDAGANIKRTARFTLKDDGTINYLSDRIQPFVDLRMKNGWAEFPLGIFLLSSPKRSDEDNVIIREIEAYDGLIVLKEDRFSDRHTITAGTNYVDAVIAILQSAGITKWNIEQTDKLLNKDIEFEPGKEKLFAANDLLRQINFNGLKHDVYGYYSSSYYRSPSQRAAEYTYIDDKESVTLPGMEEEYDLTELPNQFVIVRTNPEQEPLKSIYTNDNPDSPTSTVNRGRIITDYREIDDVADQESLDSYTLRVAAVASQVYGRVRHGTAIMPHHDTDDIISINYSRLGINAKYSETSWTIPLDTGDPMTHELRRVIDV